MSFGKRLRTLRQGKFLTQAELAQLLGVSTSAIGMYEQGRREPDFKVTKKICEVFDVSSDYLLDGNEKSDDIPSVTDVSEIIADIKSRFQTAEGLMFNGVPLSEEDVKKLTTAIEVSAAIVLGDKEEKNGQD